MNCETCIQTQIRREFALPTTMICQLCIKFDMWQERDDK